MNRRFLALTLLLVTLAGCAAKDINPSVDAIQQTRVSAVRIADATKAGLTILDEVGKLLVQLPLNDSQKNAFNCGILKATGTTALPSPEVQTTCQPHVGALPQGPGPLHRALGVLGNVTSEPSLRMTVSEILLVIDPLMAKLETSENSTLRGFGAALRATFLYTRLFLGGA